MAIFFIAEPLRKILYTYCDVNAPEMVYSIADKTSGVSVEDLNLFKSQLINAIKNESISPEEYEKLTGDVYNSQEELQICLREIYSIVFDENSPV